MPQTPEAVALAFVSADNRHDVAELARLMTGAHRFIDSLGNIVQGNDKMRAGWAGYFRIVPDYTVFVNETFSDGSTVVIFGLARGTYSEDGKTLLPKNVWQTPIALRAQIEEGNVAEWRVYADNEPIRRLMNQSK